MFDIAQTLRECKTYSQRDEQIFSLASNSFQNETGSGVSVLLSEGQLASGIALGQGKQPYAASEQIGQG